ncbi:hypothetical protein LINGRAHAP2_LOCUS37545 [Linum grandiflorum]
MGFIHLHSCQHYKKLRS